MKNEFTEINRTDLTAGMFVRNIANVGAVLFEVVEVDTDTIWMRSPDKTKCYICHQEGEHKGLYAFPKQGINWYQETNQP